VVHAWQPMHRVWSTTLAQAARDVVFADSMSSQ